MTRPAGHGSPALYGAGCRCVPCCEQQRTRVARNRAARLASGRLTHGKRSSYDAGCRCERCKTARREAYARLDSEHYRQPVWAGPPAAKRGT
jgi:hypothetical protein